MIRKICVLQIPLLQPKHILPINPLIVDAVHQVTDKENAQATDGTLLNGKGGVRLADTGGVEIKAGVGDDEPDS